MPGATFPDLSVFDAVRVRARRRRSPRVGGHRWGPRSALIVVAAVLAGCTAQAEEPAPPPATTSAAEPSVEPTTEAEPEPEPEPTGLVRPEEMDRNDDAGAIAAAEYYAQLCFETLRTSDTTEWESVSGESCEFCSGITEEAQTAAEVGATFLGGDSQLRGPGKIIGREEALGVIGIDVPYRVTEQTRYRADGTPEQNWPDSEGFFYVELAHGYEGWIIINAQTHPMEY